MPRVNESHVQLPDGRHIGYSLTDRPTGYRVRFLAPDGRRVERSTGCDRKGDARAAAERIVLSEYVPASPTLATWEIAIDHLKQTPDLRPDTVRGYITDVRAVRLILPNLTGPADVTPELAHKFKRDYLAGVYVRGKASDAATYKRSPTTCATYLRGLRSLWSRHWIPAGFAPSNPWAGVPYPNVPRGRRVRVPEEDVVTAFFDWLAGRHSGWELPRLFVITKMLAGCRTLDMCKVKTSDLGADGLTLSAEATKTREARTIELPDDVMNSLRTVAGPVWLWESAAAECAIYRPSRNLIGRNEAPYDPSSWRWTIQNLFREFNRTRPGAARLRPHDLRARAITIVAAATQNVDATARAMGVDPQTARHYLDAAKAFDGRAVMRAAADLLRGKS